MTRQKKEILKKIEEIRMAILVDIELGFGYVPVGGHDRMYSEMYQLKDELAQLRHYADAEEMNSDPRRYKHINCKFDEELPFI
ncbi:MAG: hypothetical protein Q4D32_11240 [Eubacteriales bacterium]|nr:hypothetical protein [Eubacteriales bacterium]